jgi:hypothetical protein
VSNVLSEEKKQQVIALGRLGWSLRRIQGATQAMHYLFILNDPPYGTSPARVRLHDHAASHPCKLAVQPNFGQSPIAHHRLGGDL